MNEQPPQPQPAWARPVVQTVWRETQPLEYHQLLRGTPRYRWWKPLLGLLLGVIYYLTFSTIFLLVVMVPYSFVTGLDFFADPNALNDLALPDTQKPVSIVIGLGSVALMMPAATLAMLSVGLRPAGRLWSVATKIRWRWIGRTILPAFITLVITNVLGMVLEAAMSVDDASTVAEPANFNLNAALLSVVFVLLLVPLQSTAEEMIFRGVFMQTLGAWLGGVRGAGVGAFLRGPWIAIIVPAILFGFAHIYDIWGMLYVILMAVTAGWITWRTGGLEAAISLHVVNNVVVLSILASGVTGETGQQVESGGAAGSLLAAILGFAFFAWWVDRDFRKKDGRRTRIDLVEIGVVPAAPIAASEPQAGAE